MRNLSVHSYQFTVKKIFVLVLLTAGYLLLATIFTPSAQAVTSGPGQNPNLPLNPVFSSPLPSTSPIPPVGQVLNGKNLIPGFKFGGAIKIGTVITSLYQVGFYVATFVALFWLAWGIFEYIFAGGEKQKLASAQKRITWAIVGLVFVLVAYLIAQFGAQIILPNEPGVNQPANSLPIFTK